MRLFLIVLLFANSEVLYSQTAEDCKIYLKAFKEIVQGTRFVIFEKEDTQYLKNTDISQHYIDSGYRKSDPQIIQKNFKQFSCPSINIISGVKLDKIYNYNGRSKKFRLAYPGAHGYIRISRIFYNSGRKKAIFYLSYFKGYLNAAGLWIYMKKNHGQEWIVDRAESLWAS